MSNEMEKYIGIITEHFDQRVKFLAEGLSAANDLTSQNQELLKEAKEDRKYMNTHIKVIADHLSELKSDIHQVQLDLKEKDHQIITLNKEVTKLKLA